ncbi:pimeloyl-ACP methyl ester carboxylesterase [Saccharopolyspora erythraea NRRL 2338]|uniref:Hydrolase, alpha/beta fold family n=2 Tax=Saccharopolyspora erythraea TaxID=1836 RepID=A4FK47_SACEN|nr:alpha/beta hydrolase [Saccharopolyspora erythraea]EQD86996.1 alpha/beta hydrolase [Saccharopolyspora erythraea D]PFG98061.1 pimeloyl-ACP methyl ester carboxylesterase [Saccharopolyspora erythraea NRRL 2338]QRK88175.1 alpha/beta hydrolase [Saccharopolyspora erythraea]CAM04422.1 hydrolase, alpha/beta fold family [Saccharopolyspora erythraea NRRL 2338]
MRIGIDEPARLGRTELRGGRVLGWAEWGPADGTAVLLCPGAAQSRTLGFGTDLVDELGVRLISVDRPGLGVSDPAPGRTLLDFAEDVRDFAERRELPAMAVVGYSTGGPFALACAARGVAVAAAVVAGGDELPRFTGRLDPQVAETVGSVLADPRRAEETFAGFGDVDAMWDMIIAGSSEMDRAVYCRPEFEAALRRAMAGGFAQGPAGYARDTVLVLGRWPFAVEEIAVPVHLCYGEHDTSPVHSPDLGASLAGRIPGATRHLMPDAGGSVLWTHAEAILRELLEAASRG